MRIRVFKGPDGRAYPVTPVGRYQDDFSLMDGKWHPRYNGMEYIDIEKEEFPTLGDGQIIEQCFFSGEISKDTLAVDAGWDRMLMPIFLIKEKFYKKNIEALDDELNKENPDQIKVIKYNRAINKKLDDIGWYKEAKNQLDEKVASGENDKPEIRARLDEKITELEGKKGGGK